MKNVAIGSSKEFFPDESTNLRVTTYVKTKFVTGFLRLTSAPLRPPFVAADQMSRLIR